MERGGATSSVSRPVYLLTILGKAGMMVATFKEKVRHHGNYKGENPKQRGYGTYRRDLSPLDLTQKLTRSFDTRQKSTTQQRNTGILESLALFLLNKDRA